MPATGRQRGLQQSCRDPPEQNRGDQERARVDPVRDVRRRRPRRARRRASGAERPGQVVDRLEQRVRAREIVVLDEVRQARRRPPAGRSPSRCRRSPQARRSAPALVVNGSAAKTPKRTRSEPIIRRRRESRSISGPTSSPIANIGSRSAIRSAATQAEDSVLVQTSTSRATSASHVPAPEPRVAKNRRRKLGSRPRRASWVPATRGRPIGSPKVTPSSAPKRGVFRPCPFRVRQLRAEGRARAQRRAGRAHQAFRR